MAKRCRMKMRDNEGKFRSYLLDYLNILMLNGIKVLSCYYVNDFLTVSHDSTIVGQKGNVQVLK